MNFDDCRLCREYNGRKNILFESDNFFVVPSLGQIVEGYLLICSKGHYTGIGHFSTELFSEFEQVQKKVKTALTENYTPPPLFRTWSCGI